MAFAAFWHDSGPCPLSWQRRMPAGPFPPTGRRAFGHVGRSHHHESDTSTGVRRRGDAGGSFRPGSDRESDAERRSQARTACVWAHGNRAVHAPNPTGATAGSPALIHHRQPAGCALGAHTAAIRQPGEPQQCREPAVVRQRRPVAVPRDQLARSPGAITRGATTLSIRFLTRLDRVQNGFGRHVLPDLLDFRCRDGIKIQSGPDSGDQIDEFGQFVLG